MQYDYLRFFYSQLHLANLPFPFCKHNFVPPFYVLSHAQFSVYYSQCHILVKCHYYIK